MVSQCADRIFIEICYLITVRGSKNHSSGQKKNLFYPYKIYIPILINYILIIIIDADMKSDELQ